MWHELVWSLPFGGLLLCIAFLPLIAHRWWQKHYSQIAVGLGLLVIYRYLWIPERQTILLSTALEYVSFICLIGSLFVVSGGIYITVKGESTPAANCLFLFVGAVLANLLGTTGASVILIRPWIRMNRYRITAYHIAFFIFIVSNIGGSLTPIGDPPLFLGYLRGVPFFWVLKAVWKIWLLAVVYLLSVFYWMDRRNFLKASAETRAKETANKERWEMKGWINLPILLTILGSVFMTRPPFIREGIMIGAAGASLVLTPRQAHLNNDFNFRPLTEVAVLFLGIFATMMPALEWLERYSSVIGIKSVGQFYWCCGLLSAVLDNAPTYLNFLSAQIGLFYHAELYEKIMTATRAGLSINGGIGIDAQVSAVALFLQNHFQMASLQGSFPETTVRSVWVLVNHGQYLKAVSVAAVFFGALTYIGNGPNFLVKSISDHSKIRTASFFGYILRFSAPILLPLFCLIWFLFFRV